MTTPVLPFKILALAPVTHLDAAWRQPAIRVTRRNLDDVIASLGIFMEIPLTKGLHPDGRIELRIDGMQSFSPEYILESSSALQQMRAALKEIPVLAKQAENPGDLARKVRQMPGLPDFTVKNLVLDTPSAEAGGVLGDILRSTAARDQSGRQIQNAADAICAQIDKAIGDILRTIASFAPFKALTSTWQGIRFLTQSIGRQQTDVTLDLMPVSMQTLEATIDHLADTLEWDMPSLVLVDLPFDNMRSHMQALEKVAEFSQMLLTPAICWVEPGFFNIKQWRDFSEPVFIEQFLAQSAFVKWREAYETPLLRWIAMACNRVAGHPAMDLDTRGSTTEAGTGEPVWISPVYAIGALVCKSVGKMGWPTRFSDQTLVRLQDLPMDTRDTARPLAAEASFSDAMLGQLAKFGMLPVFAPPRTAEAFLLSDTTIGGGSLSYQMLISRVAHFTLAWCQDNLESDNDLPGLETAIRRDFDAFWEQAGGDRPVEAQFSIAHSGGGAVRISVKVRPSPQILASGQQVELQFNW